jgi:hypothetical protein
MTNAAVAARVGSSESRMARTGMIMARVQMTRWAVSPSGLPLSKSFQKIGNRPQRRKEALAERGPLREFFKAMWSGGSR